MKMVQYCFLDWFWVISALQRLRQKDCEFDRSLGCLHMKFKGSLNYIVRHYLKPKGCDCNSLVECLLMYKIP
jgi:hypothetical protein